MIHIHSGILLHKIPYGAIKWNIFESVLMRWINLEPIIQSIIRKRKINVRKHLTGGFLCAVLDLSGILCSLLIPESVNFSWDREIQAFPSLVFLYGDKYPLPFCELYGKSDYLQLSLSL